MLSTCFSWYLLECLLVQACTGEICIHYKKSATFRRMRSGVSYKIAGNSILSGVWQKRPWKTPPTFGALFPPFLWRLHTGVLGGPNAGMYILIFFKAARHFIFPLFSNKCISAFQFRADMHLILFFYNEKCTSAFP